MSVFIKKTARAAFKPYEGQEGAPISGLTLLESNADYESYHVRNPEELHRLLDEKCVGKQFPKNVFLINGRVIKGNCVINEKKIANYLSRHGFKAVCGADYSVDEIICIIMNADKLVISNSYEKSIIDSFFSGSELISIGECNSLGLNHLQERIIPAIRLSNGELFASLEDFQDVVNEENIPREFASYYIKENEFDSIELEPGDYTVDSCKIDNLPIQLFLDYDPDTVGKNPLLVFFHGGLEPRVNRLPHFEWRRTVEDRKEPKLFISDPTLTISRKLKNGWYFGTPEDNIIPRISKIIESIGEKIGVKQFILIGSSAGGVAAFQIGSYIDRSFSVGFSIQKDLSKGPRVHTVGFYEYVLNNLNYDTALEKYGNRISLEQTFNEKYSGFGVWVQNTGDKEHMEDHYIPFLEKNNVSVQNGLSKISDQNIYGFLTYWGEGHPVPPPRLFHATINAAKNSLELNKAPEINWKKLTSPPRGTPSVNYEMSTPILFDYERYAQPFRTGYIQFSGYASKGMSVAIKIGGKFYQASPVGDDYKWYLEVSFAPAPRWQVEIVAYDSSSNCISTPIVLSLNVSSNSKKNYIQNKYFQSEIDRVKNAEGSDYIEGKYSLSHDLSNDIGEIQDIIIVGRVSDEVKSAVSTKINNHHELFFFDDLQNFKIISKRYYSVTNSSKIIILCSDYYCGLDLPEVLELMSIAGSRGRLIFEIPTTGISNVFQGGSSSNSVISTLFSTGTDFIVDRFIDSIKIDARCIEIRPNDHIEEIYINKSINEFSDAVKTSLTTPYRRLPAELQNESKYILDSFNKNFPPNDVVDLGEIYSGVVDNVKVVGGGLCLVEDRYIIGETTNCMRNLHSYQSFTRLLPGTLWERDSTVQAIERVPVVDGKMHILLKSVWDANYGHWLWDTLTKVLLVRDSFLSEEPIWVINSPRGAMRAVVYDSLAMLGINSNDVVETDFQPRLYESIFIPGSLSSHPLCKAPEAARFLEKLAEGVEPAPFKRIYLSRNGYGRRELINEHEVWEVLQQAGFVKIAPEKMSFREQIAVFRGAEVVAGNMGAAFSSLAFSPEGVTVIALATTTMQHDFFYDITCLKGGKYYGIQGDTSDPAPSISSDFTVDVDILKNLIHRLD